MAFSSHLFLYVFLPAALVLFHLAPRRVRSAVLIAASVAFYSWSGPQYAALMLFSGCVDYACGAGIARARVRGAKGRGWLLASLCIELGLLAFFKYSNFAVAQINDLRAGFDAAPLEWSPVPLPPGISFYTFVSLSYVIDVYRGRARRANNLLDYLSYVTMFPQLMAGPIVRWVTVQDQPRAGEPAVSKFAQGVVMFQAGLAKKLLLADFLAPVADAAFGAASLGPFDAWVGILAYTFQIYFDFSGYSDMAVGVALMFGFRFPPNFERPYAAVGVTDFWRRWHLSLSTWLRDYLYISLGGNRGGALRTYFNLTATMVLGGLWHGANWTFVAWGAYQGFWLVIERLAGKQSLFGALPRAAQVALTFVITMGGWVFFRAASIGAACDYFGFMFGSDAATGPTLELRLVHIVAFAAAAVIIWGFPTTQRLAARMPVAWIVALQPAFVAALLQLHVANHVSFLYYQF